MSEPRHEASVEPAFDGTALIWLMHRHGVESKRGTKIGKEIRSMATPPDPAPKGHWLRILFVLPFVAILWVSSYNRIDPTLFGFPFYYWYQLLWVLLGAAIAGIVYKAEHRA
jgi:hypothetical protein